MYNPPNPPQGQDDFDQTYDTYQDPLYAGDEYQPPEDPLYNGGYDDSPDFQGDEGDGAYGDYAERQVAAPQYREGPGHFAAPPAERPFLRHEDDDLPETEEKVYRRSIFKPRTKKPNFVLSVLVNAVRIFAVIILIGGLAAVGTVVGIAKGYVETAPTLNLAKLGEQDQTSFLKYKNAAGQDVLLTEYKGIENRVMVSIDRMPTYLQHAFVAVEDARFYTHTGVDLKRIVGAFVANFSSGSQQGGSTITQQLIKKTVLSDELSYKRKIQEAYLAMQLEAQYTKEQILEYYLNTIYLGENYYGVQVASEGFFDKENLYDLTLRECAMLAGMTTNPYYYNPRRNFYQRSSNETTDYVAITNNRTDYVLKCMYENQFITYQQYQDALNPATANVLKSDPGEGVGMYKYAHYIEYAIQDVIKIFLRIEGLADTSENRVAMENKLRTGGYDVYLAIDPEIQQTVEDTLENWKEYPRLSNPNDSVYRPRNPDGTYDEIIQPQAAAVVLDYRTGELKAIVGGRTPPTQRKTLNRASALAMPVGSAIKPIGVYAPALSKGYSPASIAYNMPLPLPGWVSKNGYPQNYGGGGYKGPETLRYALAQSHNTATAYAMMNMVSVDYSVNFLQSLGISPDHIDGTPFGVSMGASGISPIEMTVAYGVLANGGQYKMPLTVLAIYDSNGNKMYEGHEDQELNKRTVCTPAVAWLTIDMMKSSVSSGTSKNASFSGQTIAGKTGTNSEQKGVSFIGITGYYASYIWVGHDNYKALASRHTGGNTAAPIWKAYMQKIHNQKNLSNQDIILASPESLGLKKYTTCGVSGQLATDACRNDAMGYGTVTDYWAEGTQPQVQCQMHKFQSLCTVSRKAATEYCPNVEVSQKGVVVIPEGHPLYSYINTHGSVLRQYLGEFATWRGGSDTVYCDVHSTAIDQGDYTTQNTLIPGARLLLDQAREQLANTEAGTDRYANLQSAIDYLQSVINRENPSMNDVNQAMAHLTSMLAQ